MRTMFPGQRSKQELFLTESDYALARWLTRRLAPEDRLELADRWPPAQIALWADLQPQLSKELIERRWDVSRATSYRWLKILQPRLPATSSARRALPDQLFVEARAQ